MAIPSNKPQNRILLVGGIIFALLAGVVVYLAVSNSSSKSGAAATTYPVVVAATDLSAGTQLTPTNLTVHQYLKEDLPASYFSVESQAVGQTVPVAVSAGTPITQQLLNTTSAASGTASNPASSFTIAEGYVALAIPASGGSGGATVDQMTVGYYIQAGDQIDIIADLGGATTTSHAVVYAFQDVPVLAVGYTASTSNAPAASPSASAAPTLTAPSYFVVEMPRYEAEEMTALLSGDFAQATAPAGSTTAVAGNAPLILKYVLRPLSAYGTFTVNDQVTPHTVTFAPVTITLPSSDAEPVTPSQLATALTP